MGQPSWLFNGEPLKMAQHTWFSLGLFHPYAWNYFRPLLRAVFWGPPWQGAGTRKNRSPQLKFGTGQSITRISFVFPLCEQSAFIKTQLILPKKTISFDSMVQTNLQQYQNPAGSGFLPNGNWVLMHIWNLSIKLLSFSLHPSNLLKHLRLSAAHAFVL